MSVSTRIEGDIAFVEMNDGKANAVNEAFTNALLAALDKAEQAKAVVLTGRTGFFSAGLDLKTLPSLQPSPQQAALDGFEHATRRLASFPKPIVAAVTGHAIGAGACFILACDYVVGLQGAYRVGLNEASIGVPLPPFLLELGRLKLHAPFHMRAFAHGEIFGAEESVRIGFMDEMVDSVEQLQTVINTKAAALAKIPSDSYFATKKVFTTIVACHAVSTNFTIRRTSIQQIK